MINTVLSLGMLLVLIIMSLPLHGLIVIGANVTTRQNVEKRTRIPTYF